MASRLRLDGHRGRDDGDVAAGGRVWKSGVGGACAQRDWEHRHLHVQYLTEFGDVGSGVFYARSARARTSVCLHPGDHGGHDPVGGAGREAVGTKLPPGLAAIGASMLSWALVVPGMAQSWYVGPIAKITGDIGFEMAFVLTGLLYLPLRWVEIKARGGALTDEMCVT